MALAISLQSCRTNEDLLASKEEAYYSNKFQVFTSVNNETVDYAKGFNILFEKYDSIHGTAYARTTLLKKESFNKNDSEYVEFNLHSQTMLLDDGERWVIYPMITNRQVTGLMVGILSKDETEVEFRKLDSGTDYYNEVIEKFRFAFMKSNLNQRLGNTASRCGYDGSDPCDIEEVVISAPPRPKPGGGGPKSGCTGLNNCFDPTAGVGGGGPGGNTPTVNPCDKIKSIINNPKMAAGLKELKDQSLLPKTNANYGEKGIKFKADGTPSATITGQDHSVNFGDKTGYTGGYHNHTVAGIPMLSPPDIDQLLGFARAQGNYGDPSKTYMGMVAPNGIHYVIWFSGSYNDALVTYTDETLKPFKDRYQTRYGTINSEGTVSNEAIENFFLKTLKDMGLEGKVNLQRIESNGTVKNIIKNSDGIATSIPC
ncbi:MULTISPECIES: hypothetical protein [unclassified Chryseobacterium]|uniref:hypothetical protein n=1 Tax=unclassified Chryseobacterium TaxID=2593645 RepID=UPI00226AD81C|nr:MULTISPECIES: hypothetical protein [unclassified Chryseobacterium]